MPKVNNEVETMPGWVSAHELAEIWKISRAHLTKLVAQGRIDKHAVKRIGNQLVFDLTKVKYPEAKTQDHKSERDQAAKRAAMGVR